MQAIIGRISRERQIYGVLVYGADGRTLFASDPLQAGATAPPALLWKRPIVLSVAREPGAGGAGQGWGEVQVTDFGPGIAGSELERIFLEFYRIPESGGEGSGLGLAISRRIARLLSGDFTVASGVGRETIFTLRLPATNWREATSGPQPAATSRA